MNEPIKIQDYGKGISVDHTMTSNTQKGCCMMCRNGAGKYALAIARPYCLNKNCPCHTPPESTLAYCTTCVQMTNHGVGTNGGCLKCRVTTPPESKGEDEWKDSHKGKLWSTAVEKCFQAPFVEVAIQHLLMRIDQKHQEELTTHRTQLLQEIEGEVEGAYNEFNGYEIAHDNKGAEIAQQGAELFKESILTIIRNKLKV